MIGLKLTGNELNITIGIPQSPNRLEYMKAALEQLATMIESDEARVIGLDVIDLMLAKVSEYATCYFAPVELFTRRAMRHH